MFAYVRKLFAAAAAIFAIVRPRPGKHLLSVWAARLPSPALGVLAVSLAALIPVTVSFAQPVPVSFFPHQIFPAGSTPSSVAIGDLNGDGKPDLAVTNADSRINTVSILLGTGIGTFLAPTPFGVGTRPSSVAIGDLNGDGKPDLAVANFFSDNVSILLGDGTGGFRALTPLVVGTHPVSVAIGDFNGDRKLDLAVVNQGIGTVSILLGDGTGGFRALTPLVVGTSPTSVAIGDLNGDGKLDLAVANFGSPSSVSILLGDGTGGFRPAMDFPAGSGPVSVAVADLDGDGKPDLAVANSSNTVSILLGNGDGIFRAPRSFGAGTSPTSVSIADLNGDGKPDLAVTNSANTPTVSVLLGDGTGAFGAPTGFAVSSGPVSVAIGDLDGDRKPDLVVANQNSSTVSVLINTTVFRNTVPPTTVASVAPAPNPAGWNNGSVTIILKATDSPGGSGVKSITYTIKASSGPSATKTVNGASTSFVLSAEGITTVAYHATDNAGNVEAEKTLMVRIDMTPPRLTLPPGITMNATSPAGAQVNYIVTATDNLDPSPTIACVPASGSTFPIGVTLVTCVARDAAGNASSGTFSVTVLGPAAQTSNLIALVQSFHLGRGIGQSLVGKLQRAVSGFSAGNPRGTARACRALDSFIRKVGVLAGRKLTPVQASQLIATATRIRAAGGCPAVPSRGERDDDDDEQHGEVGEVRNGDRRDR
jgi:hypothetical protein